MNGKSVKINSKRKFVGLQNPNKHYRNTRPVNALKCYIKVFSKEVSTYFPLSCDHHDCYNRV